MRTSRSSSRRGGGCASVHARIHHPGCGPGDPLSRGVGLKTTPPPPPCGPRDTPLVLGWRHPQARPLNFPLGVGHGIPLLARPLNFPSECGPGNLQGMLGYHPLKTCCKACWDTTCKACWDTTPLRAAARHAGIPPVMHAGIPPPLCEQNHEWSQNTILLASTQAVHKSPHSTVWRGFASQHLTREHLPVGSLRA